MQERGTMGYLPVKQADAAKPGSLSFLDLAWFLDWIAHSIIPFSSSSASASCSDPTAWLEGHASEKEEAFSQIFLCKGMSLFR